MNDDDHIFNMPEYFHKEFPKKYPKEVIVTINTHGRYFFENKQKKNEDLELDHFVYSPPNKNCKVIYISSVPIGIINYRSRNMSESVNDELKYNFNKYLQKKKKNTSFKNLLNDFNSQTQTSTNTPSPLFDIKDQLKNLDFQENIKKKSQSLKTNHKEHANKLKHYENIENPTQEDLHEIKKTKTEIKRLIDYFRHFDQSYSLQIFEQNNVILNKIYSTSYHEKKTSTDDFNIKILNLPEEQNNDIYELVGIQPNHADMYQITLKEIIAFLNDNGVEKIYIYDFSCGGGLCGVPTRHVRRLRRSEKMKSLKRYPTKRYRQHSLKNASSIVDDVLSKKRPQIETTKITKTTRKKQRY